MKKIWLSGKRGAGKYCVVDDDIFDKYGDIKWHLSDTGYAVNRNNNKTIRLHRLIINCPSDKVVDHKNGDKLDNRRKNLRACTQKENSKNRHGVTGYCFDKSRGKYQVRYRNKFCGRYDTEEEAKKVYKLMRSGQEYKTTRRKYYMLPKHISKQAGKYVIFVQKDKKRLRKTGIKTLQEAIGLRDKYLAILAKED